MSRLERAIATASARLEVLRVLQDHPDADARTVLTEVLADVCGTDQNEGAEAQGALTGAALSAAAHPRRRATTGKERAMAGRYESKDGSGFDMGPMVTAPPSAPRVRVSEPSAPLDRVPVVEVGPVDPPPVVVPKGGRQQRLADLFRRAGPLTRGEILAEMGVEDRTAESHRVEVTLSAMKRVGRLARRESGHWSLPGDRRPGRAPRDEDDDVTPSDEAEDDDGAAV